MAMNPYVSNSAISKGSCAPQKVNGYTREELVGHTVHELNIWDEPADRVRMLAELDKEGPIRKLVARLRTKSGDVKPTVYSADKIQVDSQPCVLAVSEDLSE